MKHRFERIMDMIAGGATDKQVAKAFQITVLDAKAYRTVKRRMDSREHTGEEADVTGKGFHARWIISGDGKPVRLYKTKERNDRHAGKGHSDGWAGRDGDERGD